MNGKEKHCRNLINKSFVEKFIIFAGGVVIAVFYLYKAPKPCMLWQMPDEGGYLYNSSQFSSLNWKSVFNNLTAYYNYGYSMLLIPLFYICKTGVSLLKGCMIINTICIVFIYILQIYLSSKIFQEKRKIIVVISFVTCFYPYLANMASFVYCEIFLYCWYLVVACFLYKAVKMQKIIWYLGLGVTLAYIFFIHTRALIVIGGVYFLIFLLLWNKMVGKKKVMVFICAFLTFFLMLYTLKKYFISTLGTGHIALTLGKEGVDNVLSFQYFLNRISWLFSNIKIYILSAIGKLFYISVSTVGTIFFGILYMIDEFKKYVKNKFQGLNTTDILKCYFFLVFLLMYIACCINGVGADYANIFYGRYYEYCLLPMVIMGIIYLINCINVLNKIVANIFIICTGILTQKLVEYVNDEMIYVDVVRMSGISYSIIHNEKYVSTINFLIIITSFCCALYGLLQRTYLKEILIPLIVFWVFVLNTKEGSMQINMINNRLSSDLYISNYIIENMNQQKIYFIYEPYLYEFYYQRMQIFIKDHPMYVILPEEVEEIEEDAFIITYIDSVLADSLMMDEEYCFVMNSKTFKLFRKGV